MFSKKKEREKIDPEQRQMIEYAQQRVKQRKNLFRHFIVFLAGAVLLIILNVVLGYGSEFKPLQTDWFVWAILIWFFLFLIHVLNVYLLNSFMNKKWENEQIDQLVAKQKAKIEKLKAKVEQDHPAPASQNYSSIEEKKSSITKPDQPLNS